MKKHGLPWKELKEKRLNPEKYAEKYARLTDEEVDKMREVFEAKKAAKLAKKEAEEEKEEARKQALIEEAEKNASQSNFTEDEEQPKIKLEHNAVNDFESDQDDYSRRSQVRMLKETNSLYDDGDTSKRKIEQSKSLLIVPGDNEADAIALNAVVTNALDRVQRREAQEATGDPKDSFFVDMRSPSELARAKTIKQYQHIDEHDTNEIDFNTRNIPKPGTKPRLT